MNLNRHAEDFIMYCAPTVKTFEFNGNGEFVGIIVASEADMTMNGGGNSNNDFSGCLITGSVVMNGHYSFHYDEALGRKPGTGRLLITSWDEINPNAAP
jgi:hypothetical protein